MRVVRLVAAFAVSGALLPLALATRLAWRLGWHGAGLRGGARVQRWWARGVRRALGIRLEVVGTPPPVATLVVSNHLSYLDILVLGSVTPGRFVAKSEISRWPVFGELSRSVGTLFISQRERRDVLRVAEAMERTLAEGVPVILFPEAAASRGVRVEAFKSSLLEPLVRLQLPSRAVAITYRTPDAPYGAGWTACWWGDMQLWTHVWRLLAGAPVFARITWDSESIVAPDRKLLSGELHRRMARLFEGVEQEPLPGAGYPWPELVSRIQEAP